MFHNCTSNELEPMTVSKISDEILDELVCGDVPVDRYRAILSQLDAEPEKWRDCALAFLQEQAIESDMRWLSVNDADWDNSKSSTKNPSASSGENSTANVRLESAPDSDLAKLQLQRLQRWTSIAASVLIAFTVGWVGSGFMGDSSPQTTAPTIGDGGLDVASAEATQPRRSDFAPGTSFANSDSVILDNDVPEEVRRLERQGYRILTKNQLVPVRLQDGTQAIVPMNTYQALPPAQAY